MGIAARFCLFTPSCVHRFLISGPDLVITAGFAVATDKIGPPAAQSWGAGRGRCHEGGIILSKKPPEWHLSLPQQRYASDSNLPCCEGEWFRLQWSLLQGRFARLQQPERRQVRQRRQRRVLMRPEAAFPYVFAAEGAQHPLIGRRAELLFSIKKDSYLREQSILQQRIN